VKIEEKAASQRWKGEKDKIYASPAVIFPISRRMTARGANQLFHKAGKKGHREGELTRGRGIPPAGGTGSFDEQEEGE